MKSTWNLISLGDLTAHRPICYGVLKPGERQSHGVPLIRITDITADYLDESDIYQITPALSSEFRRSVLDGGEVLLSIQGTIGRVAICPPHMKGANISRTIALISPDKRLNRSFLRYWLLSLNGEFPICGATRASLNIGALRELKAPVPMPAEQQRIVELLDEAFAGLATAQANAEKNLQNARALFESHLQSVFSQRGAKWDRITLETLLERGWIEGHLDGNHGSDYPRKDEFIGEGVPYISANCLDDERVDMSRAKYLSPSRASMLRKGIAKDNDVLFAHNATVGPVAILRTDQPKVILGTSLTYYRCDPAHILPEYLAHYMRSFGFKTQYLQVMRQSTRNQVPITKQREFFHVVPPLDEQRQIIGALDGLFENGQHLEALYQRKLEALTELKKSLLHQAFNGKL